VPDNWNYVTATITNLNVAPGQEVWLNWQMVKLGSTGSSIAAIDNVRVGNFGVGNPAIFAQPMPQSIILGNNASVAVTASGTSTLSYQWRRNGTNITASNNPTTTSAVLTLSNAQPTDVGNYDVVVTSGSTSITSAIAPVQVYTRVGVVGAATNSVAVAPILTNYTTNASYFDIPAVSIVGTNSYTNRFDLYVPDAPAPASGRPAVVVIHGGGGNDGDKIDGREVQASQEFASHGYVALSINYKRSFQTKSSGNWTTAWPQNIKDAKTAVRWLRANATNYGIDPNRIGAIGFSWGGNEAAMLAVTDGDAALRVACVQVKFRRRQPDDLVDQPAREAHTLAVGLHLRPGVAQDLPGLRMEEVHADLFQHLQRRLVDGLEFVGRDGGNGCEGRARLRAGLRRAGLALGAGAPAAAAGVGDGLHAGLQSNAGSERMAQAAWGTPRGVRRPSMPRNSTNRVIAAHRWSP
jgi:alpha/beta superfamily hydrolase